MWFTRSEKSTGSGSASPPRNDGGVDPERPDRLHTRITKLESDVAHLAADMTDVRASLRDIGKDLADTRLRVATLETKVDLLPGKGFIVSVVATGLRF